MTSAQKVIKYFAIAFAIFLIVTILSAILGGIYAFARVLGLKSEKESIVTDPLNTIYADKSNLTVLEIDVLYTNLVIKTGDSFQVDTNNPYITANHKAEKLEIKEEKHNRLWKNTQGDVILYLPEGALEKVRIEAGAGNVKIENLIAEQLEFELGAGETKIEKLEVSQRGKIDSGAGKMTISSGFIHDLDFNMGVGEVNLTAILIGKNTIDTGVGSLKMNLKGDPESYQIRTDKGLGSVKIDGKEIADKQVWGNGDNSIAIDGGVGNIRINF